MTQDNLFQNDTPVSTEPTSTNNERDYLGELVGDGKKFKSPADLAKGKLEADTFIERLKEENRQLREAQATQEKLSTLIDKLAQSTPSDNESYETPSFNPEDLDKILEQKLNERDSQRKASQNIQFVKDELKKQYGEHFTEKLKVFTQELGVSPQEINRLAAQSPQAVLKLLNSHTPPAPPPPTTRVPPASSVNIPVTTTVNTERNQAYYDKIKETDKSRYWSAEVQMQMHNDAIRLGDKFFN